MKEQREGEAKARKRAISKVGAKKNSRVGAFGCKVKSHRQLIGFKGEYNQEDQRWDGIVGYGIGRR